MSNVSALSCAEVRELAPELALGILSGARARRSAAARQRVLALPGLRRRAHRSGRRDPAARARGRTAGRASRPACSVAWVSASAAPADGGSRPPPESRPPPIIVSITVVRVVESGRQHVDTALPAPTSAIVGQAGRRADASRRLDVAAGWAYVSDGHGVAVAVSYGIPSGRLRGGRSSRPTDVPRNSIGTMTVADDRGSWTGRSSRRDREPGPHLPGRCGRYGDVPRNRPVARIASILQG